MQKKVRLFIIIGAFFIALLFGINWIQQYLARTRASATPPTASFSIEGPKVASGQSFDLLITINPNLTPFYSFDVAFSYDHTKVDAVKMDAASTDIVILKGEGTSGIDASAHTVRISALRATGASDPFIGRDPIKMVKVGFTLKPGQELPLEFKWLDPEPGKTSTSDSFEKKNLVYTGEEPTPTQGPTAIPAIGVPTGVPASGTVQPTGAYNSLTPVPTIQGSSGQTGTSIKILERKDLLYINSIVTYQSPYRYEQPLKLEKGSYTLKIGAKVYVRKERGMVVALICNESTCGSKKSGQMMYVSPVFPVKTEFSEMTETVAIPDDADNKNYILRVFCEDGSECELDYISLEDAWGTERIQNNNFESSQTLTDPRKQPASWEVDTTANLYGSVDESFGKNGSLMINNPAK